MKKLEKVENANQSAQNQGMGFLFNADGIE